MSMASNLNVVAINIWVIMVNVNGINISEIMKAGGSAVIGIERRSQWRISCSNESVAANHCNQSVNESQSYKRNENL
jgi:hypothetical protein